MGPHAVAGAKLIEIKWFSKESHALAVNMFKLSNWHRIFGPARLVSWQLPVWLTAGCQQLAGCLPDSWPQGLRFFKFLKFFKYVKVFKSRTMLLLKDFNDFHGFEWLRTSKNVGFP